MISLMPTSMRPPTRRIAAASGVTPRICIRPGEKNTSSPTTTAAAATTIPRISMSFDIVHPLGLPPNLSRTGQRVNFVSGGGKIKRNIPQVSDQPSTFHHDSRRRLDLGAALDSWPDLTGDLDVNAGKRRAGLGRYHRFTRIRSFPQPRIERYFPKKRNAEPMGFLARSAMAEDRMALAAFVADEIAHVLDNTEHRHAYPAEHVEAFARIDQRQILRRRHDDGARQGSLLGERQLHVAGAWRHVDDHHVGIAPDHFSQHLHERLHHHRPPPDHRRVFGDKKAHG